MMEGSILAALFVFTKLDVLYDEKNFSKICWANCSKKNLNSLDIGWGSAGFFC
jgi:hypothetical protein